RHRAGANALRGEEVADANIQGIGSAFGGFDAWDDILGLHDFATECIKAELDRRRLDPLHFQSDERAIGIAKDSHSIESRYEFTQQFKSEAPKIGLHVR